MLWIDKVRIRASPNVHHQACMSLIHGLWPQSLEVQYLPSEKLMHCPLPRSIDPRR